MFLSFFWHVATSLVIAGVCGFLACFGILFETTVAT